ncbi:hydroxymethylbilane synthase [Helicobacter didelphidarum]|uniref:Porphobilinogen deaminase n=1 Tax=Helicobacter didelphidarum TaxID=2040648 RepID=A0A3D8IN70_9HELI|nr:hydroxymethylbilane synthase [Helicobacter didelphidarum]RDU66375.1 hydroxymethylbilane synthase [Helicobacter didelphidarum]
MNIAQRYKDELAKTPLILGTRGSMLALWQANHIKERLESQGIGVELKSIKTKGDKILDAPLAKIGGKGLFTKELENELLCGNIDFAVHSLKDMPVIIEPQLMLASITKREDPRDCFVSEKYPNIESLPKNAKVGTTSLRRSMQLHKIRSDIDTQSLRGNVQTRLQKLKNGEFDAIILAAAGLKRLGIAHEIPFVIHLETNEMIPAMAQGSLGLECRDPKYSPNFRDQAIYKVLESLHHKESALCCNIERAFIQLLGGGCQSPIGIHVTNLKENQLKIECIVGNLEATKVLTQEQICLKGEVEYVLQNMINSLKNRGVDEILSEINKK